MPMFSIGHLLQAPATQQEPLTQMDVKKKKMFNLSRFKHGQLFKKKKTKLKKENKWKDNFKKSFFLKIKMLYENIKMSTVFCSTGYLEEPYWWFCRFLSTKYSIYHIMTK